MTERRASYLFKELRDMELFLQRETFTDKSTIGRLFIDGQFECYVLEDKDRGLKQEMSLNEISQKKVYGQTCIPYGRYEIDVTMSNRFKKELPLLLNVKGYDGIRIHTGNTDIDTHGCLLTGQIKGVDSVSKSTPAFNLLFEKIRSQIKYGKKVFITISK